MGQVQADLIGESTQQCRTDQDGQGTGQCGAGACSIALRTCSPDRKTESKGVKERNTQAEQK